MNAKTLVLSTAPHNFAGAGAAHAKTLELLALVGANVQFFTPSPPFRADRLEKAGVKIVVTSSISDAYPTSDIVIYGAIADAMARIATAWLMARNDNKVIILSTYLFPFCMAAEWAASSISHFSDRVKCIINPAGSDIWQIAKQMPHVAQQVINSRYITDIVTYSTRFAEEIESITSCTRHINIIPPAIDVDEFFPMTQSQRIAKKQELGIDEGEFIISHCSNHRPVKGVAHSIEIAKHFSQAIKNNVRLLMIGPMTSSLCQALESIGMKRPNEETLYDERLDRLRVTCTGLQRNVQHYHAVSDVAINTSLHDSFNISLGEAMACGIPVLTTDVAGISSIITKHRCGHTLPFRYNSIYNNAELSLKIESAISIDSAVKWLISIYKCEGTRFTLGKQARKAIVEQCSDQVVASKWYQLCGLFNPRTPSHMPAFE